MPIDVNDALVTYFNGAVAKGLFFTIEIAGYGYVKRIVKTGFFVVELVAVACLLHYFSKQGAVDVCTALAELHQVYRITMQMPYKLCQVLPGGYA